MQIVKCKKFNKDLKELKKRCKNVNIEEQIISEIKNLLNTCRLEDIKVKLFQTEGIILYKTRINWCGEGKRGGIRLIWGISKQDNIIILLTAYLKSEKENILDEDIIEILKNCY